MAVEAKTHAWTYYGFGARSFEHDIRALILDELDQARDPSVLRTVMREELEAGRHPLVTILPEEIPLEPQRSDAVRIGRMARLLVPIDLQHHGEALLYLGERPELLAKIRDRMAQQIAAGILETVLARQGIGGRIDAMSTAGEILEACGPYREAVCGSFPEGIGLDPGGRQASERAVFDDPTDDEPQNNQ